SSAKSSLTWPIPPANWIAWPSSCVRKSNASAELSRGGTVLQRFGQMLAADLLPFRQVGQRACDLEYAMGGAQGQTQAFAGVFQPLAIRVAQGTVLTQAGKVEKGIGHTLAAHLPLTRVRHFGRGLGSAFTLMQWGVQSGAFTGDGQVQVDTVQQRPGQLGAVALDLLRGAAAAIARVTEIAARAGVHRRDQLKARREAHLVTCPGNHDMAAFQ